MNDYYGSSNRQLLCLLHVPTYLHQRIIFALFQRIQQSEFDRVISKPLWQMCLKKYPFWAQVHLMTIGR